MEEKVNEINYKKNIKHQKSVKPKKMNNMLKALIKLVVKFGLSGVKHTLTENNMEDINKNNKNFFLLCNHNSFNDFLVVQGYVKNRNSNSVVSIDAFDIKSPLLRAGGTIPKRKFTNDVGLIRNLIYVKDKLNSIPVVYPEARYSCFGTNAIIPESLAKICKLLKLPVVVCLMKGHHLLQPQWGDFKMRKEVPIHAEVTQILTAEEVAKLSVEEIYKIICNAFIYDDYRYWQETGFKITHKNRGIGLHKILYKCVNCKTEFKMTSFEDTVKCKHCNSEWELTETGFLNCKTGETKFNHIPDWCEWEREEVKKELKENKFEISDTMDAWGMPAAKYVIPLGKVNFKQTKDGFEVKGHYNKQNFKIVKPIEENYSIQHEYRLPRLKKIDCIALSTDNDTIFMKPTVHGYVQKIYFATEEAHKLKVNKLKSEVVPKAKLTVKKETGKKINKKTA